MESPLLSWWYELPAKERAAIAANFPEDWSEQVDRFVPYLQSTGMTREEAETVVLRNFLRLANIVPPAAGGSTTST